MPGSVPGMLTDLAQLDPSTTAVVTMELQRGVCGDLAPTHHLARAVTDAGVDRNAARLVTTARLSGARVVHCTFSIDERSVHEHGPIDLDLPLMAAARASTTLLRRGDPSTALLDGLGPEAGDLVAERHHGLTPFTGTDLAERLRDAGVTALVATGVSLNIGIPGLVSEAVGCGLDVVVATDAVVGLPVSFGEDVLRNSLAWVALLATTDEIAAALER
jgi:nicotinamidase-related amidase